MMAGASTVDCITANLLPITARHFTDNIGLISFMVALNRICGFLVQPYAAWKSDRHRSAGGRRRPYLLVGWPTTLASLGLLGALPFLVPEAYHRTTLVLAVAFIANLVMQAFLDLCFGCGDTLYGDRFVSGEIGRANGVRLILNSLAGVAMASVFVPLADRHEFYPYLGAMGFVGIAWFVTAFLMKEAIPDDLPPRARYTPLEPLLELRDPQTRNVTIVASAVLVALALTEMLHALFVTETLGFSKTVLGQTTTAGIVLTLACSYPLGLLVDRVGARPVMIAGFAMLALVEAGIVFWVHDVASLTVCMVLFKVSWLTVHLPVVPLMFFNTPAERRGSIFAAVQMSRAAVASVATVLAGTLAGWMGSYRVCYLLAGAACLVGLVGALRLEPAPRAGARLAVGT
jgi:Na+/melibiose symporter-like transporter